MEKKINEKQKEGIQWKIGELNVWWAGSVGNT
jgi:hypothetical protein